MLIILIFLLFTILLATSSIKKTKEIFLISLLLFSTIIVFLTEVLSLFNCLNLFALSLFWLLFSITIFYNLFKNRKTFLKNIKVKKIACITFYTSLEIKEKCFIFLIFFFLSLLFLQGILYPPNNWDSLTYHMSRIMYWIGNQSVNHFPTHILRELYQPPFTEYFILQVNLLNGNDYLSNSVQWLFLVFSIFPIWLILDFYKISRFYKLLSILILITIPSVELQASTTKNDIVCGFFILSSLYFSIRSYCDTNLNNFLLLGISVGLCMLTKGTAYLFLLPILLCLLFFILFKIISTRKFKIILYGISAIMLLLFINIGHYYRNYQINKDILNIDEIESKMYSNEKMNTLFLTSNIIKNIGLHLGYPIFQESDTLIKKLHHKLKIDINSPKTNYYGMNYQVSQELITHEDGVCNTLHILLLFGAIIALLITAFFKFKENLKIFLLLLILILQFIFFCGFLKWQPWHTRLHIPLFMLSSILIIIVAQKVRIYRVILITSIPLLILSFGFYFLFNNIRPIINNSRLTKTITISDSRFKKYFANQPNLYIDYSNVLNSMYSSNPKKVGLMISDWEYPLFHEYYYDKIKIQSINVSNITKTVYQDTKNIEAIISNKQNEEFIIFNDHKYINQTPKNEYIWFYK